jgi:hypothetical protein
MENRTYTVALAMVFALIAVVTCLIVLAILLLTMHEGEPLLTISAPSQLSTPTLAPTLRINITVEPSLVVPLAIPPRLVTSTVVAPLPTQPVFLSMPVQLTPQRIPAIATSTPKSLRQVATPTPKAPVPTATLASNFQFAADGEVKPDTTRACTGSAIFGYFHDAAGKPLAGMRVKVYNQYLLDNNISAPSKPVGAPDAGYYDFLINPKPSLWNVVVVDNMGSPISAEVQVIRPTGVNACYFQVDWKATR